MAQPGPSHQSWGLAPGPSYSHPPSSIAPPPQPPSAQGGYQPAAVSSIPPPQQASNTSISSSLTASFPSTAHLSRTELQRLLGTAYHPSQSDEAFLDFVEGLEGTKALREEVRRLREECEGMAAANLALKPQLDSLRAETQAAFDRAKALESEWPRVEAQQREAYKRFAPDSLHATLTQTISRLHDDSESLATSFVEGVPYTLEDGTEINVDDEGAFVKRYRALRDRYHKRNIVAERWGNGGVTWRDE